MQAACVATVLAAPNDLPPLVEPASAERHVGKVVWVDLVTPDLDSAKRFYSGLFGWTFRNAHAGKTAYSVALLDGLPVAGLFLRPLPAGEQRQPAWLTFIAVADIEVAKRTALEHGARIVSEPKSYPRRGRQAILADPEGAVFAVLASSSGDPADFLAVPGEWIWSSLMVKDPEKEAAFYQAVFGYDVFDLQNDDDVDHVILSTDDFARASVNAFHRDPARHRPHWFNFVRVVDALRRPPGSLRWAGACWSSLTPIATARRWRSSPARPERPLD